MSDLLALALSGGAVLAGALALISVNHVRPVLGRLAAGLGGIMLTAYGVVTAGDAAAPVLGGAQAPVEPIVIAVVPLMCVWG